MIYICKPKKVSIYLNPTRKKPAQIKTETGCTAIINGGLFNMSTLKATGNLKANGVEVSREWDAAQGYAWTGDELPVFGWSDMKVKDNFIGCVAMVENGKMLKMNYPSAMGGARPRTAFGTFADGRVWIYATSVNTTPETLQQVAFGAGVKDAIMLDGGGSTQGISPDGVITSTRAIPYFVCVWADEETTPENTKEQTMAKYKVCIDPGHGGSDKSNGSPDGLFKEYKFTLDIALRVKRYLVECGVDVILTRDEDESVSLATRAAIANAGGANLFVSVHSNATGTAYADAEGWGDAKGLCVFTYGEGDELKRNILANKILDAMRVDGVNIHGAGLFHAKYVVLAQTTMPAVLVEYGFHTNKEETELLKSNSYRERLAYNTAKGICEYLGVEEPLRMDTAEGEEEPEEEAAVEWAKTQGVIADREDLNAPVTKNELVNILYKLNN